MTKPKPKPRLIYDFDVGVPDAEGKIVGYGVFDDPGRPRGRPSKASTTFKRYARVLAKDTAAREFLERDAAMYAVGDRRLVERADKVGISEGSYAKRLTRARKVCPEYGRRVRGIAARQ